MCFIAVAQTVFGDGLFLGIGFCMLNMLA